MRAALIIALISATVLADEPDPVDPGVKKALEQANGIPDFASLARAAVKKTKAGWEVSWSHPIGDSGHDECTARFRADGSLESQTCQVEYVTHSMGPSNARWKTDAQWTFDAAGTLTAFKGKQKSVVLATNKVGVNKTFKAPDDEVLGDMCKPLLKLDESLRK